MRLADPYAGVDWTAGVRGNLHCHSTQSDGDNAPQDVITAYASRGYGFLMLSDHDLTTTRARYAQWDAGGLALLPGSEVSREGSHILSVGTEASIEPVEDRQRVIDAIRAAGGLAVLNHPNWFRNFDHWPQAAMAALDRYHGIEIYNAVIEGLEGSSYALDRWDRLLSLGKRVWGFANDDAHKLSEIGQGWNVAFPRTRDADGVVAALRGGRFYASTGVAIDAIEVAGDRVRIRAQQADRIVAVADHGKRIAIVDAGVLEVKVPETAQYVRFECYGRGERHAWTQPFHVEK